MGVNLKERAQYFVKEFGCTQDDLYRYTELYYDLLDILDGKEPFYLNDDDILEKMADKRNFEKLVFQGQVELTGFYIWAPESIDCSKAIKISDEIIEKYGGISYKDEEDANWGHMRNGVWDLKKPVLIASKTELLAHLESLESVSSKELILKTRSKKNAEYIVVSSAFDNWCFY